VIHRGIDWKDEDTDVSKLIQNGNLWEDNWDDDDVEDDFSKQLRCVITPDVRPIGELTRFGSQRRAR
jgi:DSS1/SEM1 family